MFGLVFGLSVNLHRVKYDLGLRPNIIKIAIMVRFRVQIKVFRKCIVYDFNG